MSAAAGMSSCASELAVKNAGYSAVQITVAPATSGLLTRRARRHTPSNVNDATRSMAKRVTTGVNALNFHQKASHNISSGGCALERVE